MQLFEKDPKSFCLSLSLSLSHVTFSHVTCEGFLRVALNRNGLVNVYTQTDRGTTAAAAAAAAGQGP